jgi:acetyl esterase
VTLSRLKGTKKTMKIWVNSVFGCLLAAKALAAVTTQDFIYAAYGTDPTQQTLTVYYPDGWSSNDLRTCMVLFHGGGWTGGDKSQMYDVCNYFANRGLVAVTANYRLNYTNENNVNPTNPIYGVSIQTICVQDAKTVLRWVKINHAMLGINTNLIASGGDSAGAHISTLSQIDYVHNNTNDLTSLSTQVKALVLFSPAFGNSSTEPENVFSYYSATNRLPPIGFLCGEVDSWKAGSDQLLVTMRKIGDDARFWQKKNQGHNYWQGAAFEPHACVVTEQFLKDIGLLTAEQ